MNTIHRQSGRFTKGGMLPQTCEGWLNRFITLSERKTIGKIGLKPITDKKAKDRARSNPVKNERIKEQRRLSYTKHREPALLRMKNTYHENKLVYSKKYKEYYKLNADDVKAKQSDWYWNRGGREIAKEYARNNPKSGGGSDDIEIILAMNNVRKRQNNTCQWYGCGLTHRVAPIHVHHIFPRSEYPELATVEQYMICYCANHHALFHRARGDWYSEIISPSYQETSMDKITIRNPWGKFKGKDYGY